MSTLHKKLKKFIAPVLIALCFFVLGGAASLHFMTTPQRQTPCGDKSQYTFINPNMTCGNTAVIRKTDYGVIENKVTAFIASEQKAGRLTDAAVYFRDLKNGPVFGVNEEEDFAPASLLKLPLAFVFLNQAEPEPEILNMKLQFDRTDWEVTQTFPPTKTIEPHTLYTVEDLLARMLSYSDNNAYGLLEGYLKTHADPRVIPQTYLELGFLDPASITDDTMSVRQYSALFRVLYNVSYLNAPLSEKMLSWLAQSDFAQGLRGGVPDDVVIAHKFGERATSDGVKQLHDCGIIYYPGNPYTLCVMTRGKDYDDLAAVIRQISGTVYTEVKSRQL